jgi:adenine-specific DNA-methyltransferase
MTQFKNNLIELNIGDYKNFLPIKDVQTVITDPPYNIGYNYNKKINDKKPFQEYEKLIEDVLNLSYESTKKDSSLFLINYPTIIFKLYNAINNTDWKVNQFIQWIYSNNSGGKSSNKFTTASRTIAWLTKDNPKVYIDRLLQPYKDPKDKRVLGRKGAILYNWWNIDIVKGNSKQHLGYVNQIPQELLMRLIITTTDKNDLVADFMCGSGSTLLTAQALGRKGFGCDINPDLKEIWKNYNIW